MIWNSSLLNAWADTSACVCSRVRVRARMLVSLSLTWSEFWKSDFTIHEFLDLGFCNLWILAFMDFFVGFQDFAISGYANCRSHFPQPKRLRV